MKSETLDGYINAYVGGWHDAVAPRIIIGVAGLLILFLIVRQILKKNSTLVSALLWLAVSSLLLVFSIFPQEVIRAVISTQYDVRIRVVMGAVSLVVLLITLESIRQTKLQERYALLWVATALVILVCVFFPRVVLLFRLLMGMDYIAAVATVAFTFLILVLFHFSISMSVFQTKQAKIAQRVALLEARIRELEVSGKSE